MDYQDKVFRNICEEYKRTTSFEGSRIRQDLVKEHIVSGDYKGRELYELIQNAEDANSAYIKIELDTENKVLKVANGGGDCSPFSKEGFCSIMMSDMSPKQVSSQEYIGCKGLGFRSLVNWAQEINVISAGVKCSFSRGIAKK